MSEKIIVSSLPKTWILDLDGTIVKHNGWSRLRSFYVRQASIMITLFTMRRMASEFW